MRFGLIARADDRGLGNQTWEVHRHYKPDRTLVVRVRGSEKQGFQPHLDRFPDALVAQVNERSWTLPEDTVRDFLKGLDVVYTAETLYDWRIVEWAADAGCATVVHCNPEFYTHHRTSHPHPTQWWAPTDWRLEHLPEGTRVVPMPVPTDRFGPVDPDDVKRQVLHVGGRPATGDRNGTNIVRAAFRDLDCELLLTSQSAGYNLRGATVRHNVKNYWDIYDDAPILLLPRRYGGLCLPANEACAAGAVPVMPDVSPNRRWPIEPLRAHRGTQVKLPTGAVPSFDCDPADLVTAVRDLWDRLPERRRECLAWAEANSYEALEGEWMEALADAADDLHRPRPKRRDATVTVVVPYTGGRDGVWGYVRQWYEQLGWPIIEASTDGPWSKGRALASVMDQVDTDIVVVADCDCIVSRDGLRKAVDCVANGAPWVVPHTDVLRMREDETERILSEPPGPIQVRGRRLAKRRYGGVAGGGIVVIPRAAWDTAPMDPRFEGWGYEDISWGLALDTLVGEHVRLTYDLVHLWHPPQPNQKHPSPESEALYAAYCAAHHMPGRMEHLVAGSEPESNEPLETAARFTSTARIVRMPGGHRLRFMGGEVEVTDPDIAAWLRSRPDCEEV